MTIELIRTFFGFCTVVNMGILLLWFAGFTFAHDWIYKIHEKWFKIPVEKYDTINYALMGAFKLAIFFFNLVPYLALRCLG